MSVERVTITIHDHLDPECEKFQGTRAPWGFRWLFTCDECRQAKKEIQDDHA